jgi:hypothetical protein
MMYDAQKPKEKNMVTEAMKKLLDYFRPKAQPQAPQPVEQVKPARPRKEERRAVAKPAAKKTVAKKAVKK